MQFSENNFTVATNKHLTIKEDVNYKLSSAKISMLLSYVFIENQLSLEIGPTLQVNGKLNLDSNKENNIISGTSLFAKDIIAISNVNFFPTIGITAGVKHLRTNISYQYGINNMFVNLNSQNLGVNFKGNAGILNGNIILYL
jgi:hypothetical protein